MKSTFIPVLSLRRMDYSITHLHCLTRTVCYRGGHRMRLTDTSINNEGTRRRILGQIPRPLGEPPFQRHIYPVFYLSE